MSQAVLLVLVFSRLSGMLLVSPWLQLKGLPLMWKALLVGCLSLVVFPVLPPLECRFASFELLGLGVLWELAVGAALGYLTGLAASLALSAGSLLDLQTGLSNATILDPTHAENRTLLSSLYQTLFLLLLWGTGGQQRLLLFVLHSFTWMPLGRGPQIGAGASLMTLLLGSGAHFFSLLFSLALPLVLALLAVDVLLAFFSRLIPQVNMMIVGAPLKILLAYFLIWVSLPATLQGMDQVMRSFRV